VITYHVGDATEPDLEGSVMIAHVLSDAGAFGAGFAAALASRYPRSKARFQAWARSRTGTTFRLGMVQWVGVGDEIGLREPDRWVANMVAQHGLRSASNPHPLDLVALRECLYRLVHGPVKCEHIVMPRIGCGLAGGNWAEVQPVIEDALAAENVHVYDLLES
jgi:O-acetyl-ADP-ribose deacetylase (regulator of RNase III)